MFKNFSGLVVLESLYNRHSSAITWYFSSLSMGVKKQKQNWTTNM